MYEKPPIKTPYSDETLDWIENRNFENVVNYNVDSLLLFEEDRSLYSSLFSPCEKRRFRLHGVVIKTRDYRKICLSDKAIKFLRELEK